MPNWTKEQLDAINLDNSNIIVSAGAGSGKTAVLSERVLRKVMNGVDIDKLLVLTFTNAAAKEMKERIRKKLRENNFTEQLNKLDSAYITTFDSYALSIVKKYHYLLNINKNISICEQSIMSIKKREILEQVFLDFYENEKFLKFIDDFCSKDDKDIKEYILQINDKLDMIYNKDKYLENYIDNYYNDNYIDEKIRQYEELLQSKIYLVNKNLEELENYVDNDYYQKLYELLGELLISTKYDDIKVSIPKLPNIPKNSEEEAIEIKSKISELLKELTSFCSYSSKEEIKKSIWKTKEYVEVIIDIIKDFDSKISEYKFKNDLYEFVDIAKMAIKLLESNEEIKEELNYNEILIDEYQDTNDLQDLFISYLENNNVYMVGDIKQSIYRFRNANPNLFKTKYDNYSLNNGGIKIDLNKNFRSREEVLNNINLIFNLIMDDIIGGANYKKEHQMIYGNMGYSNEGKVETDSNLEILYYDQNPSYKKNEIEIFLIANDIKKKINNYKVFDKENSCLKDLEYSDIAILIDRTTDFDLYKKIFEYIGIPLTLYKDETVNDSVDFNIIKNIIAFMITKNETEKKYSYMSILRSYLFRLSDEEIFDYIVKNDYSYLDNYLIDTQLLTPKELTTYIIDKFNFYEKLITVGNIDNHMAVIDYLLDLSENLTNMGYDIEEYYDYLSNILNNKIEIKYSVGTSNSNSVKIMTIHKSKGLEFPICYYSGLTSKFNISDLKERIIFDKNLGIITPIIDNGIRNTIYTNLLKNSYLKDEISEKIRLFYVALTRAEEKMILVLPKNEINNVEVNYDAKMKYRSLSDVIYSIIPMLSSYINNVNLEDINITHDYNLTKQNNYRDKIDLIDEKIDIINLEFENKLITKSKFSKEINNLYSIDDYKNLEFGKYIHSVFEHIDFNNPDYSDLDEFVKQKVSNFINSDLFEGVINIYKEYEFIYDNNMHGFIDLLLEYSDEYKIVDYKLKNIVDDAYIKQLRGYKEYLSSISNKKISIYLYSILDGKLQKLE